MLILFEQIYFIIYLSKIITTSPILSIVKSTLAKYLFEQLTQYDIIVKTKITNLLNEEFQNTKNMNYIISYIAHKYPKLIEKIKKQKVDKSQQI